MAGIAYFILAHRKPEQLRLLIDTLLRDPAARDDTVLLHIDLKSLTGLRAERRGMWQMARHLARTYPQLTVMRPRFTNWGGWSLSQIHLDAIKQALARSDRWSHFVNLSGQCFPIKPLRQVRAVIADSGDQVFVEMVPFRDLPETDWHVRRYRMIELPVRAIWYGGPRPLPTAFSLTSKGAQWSILPRAFCEWQRTAPITRRITSYLRHSLLSDELIIQTLVANGPWRERVAPHYGREIVWPGPQVMTMADWPRLMSSPGLFARKFDMDRDPAILEALADHVGGTARVRAAAA